MCEISRQKSVFYFFIEIFFRMCQTTSRRRTGRRRPRTRIYWANQTRRERIRDWLTGNGITILVQEDETSNSEREQPILDQPPLPKCASLYSPWKNAIFYILSFWPKKLQKKYSTNILIIIFKKFWAFWALEFLKYLFKWLINKVCDWGGVKSQ